ncbi:DUF4333 domain-containing protein [Pseudonocardia nantongensis]|uniref:DUF4333 domain-containing protein n=1 Tax=Pseudonocardia nantongensis TaxID=1181885 RepID=UPI00397C4521
MSNPQGPDRHPEDDAGATERTGELPAVGAAPPGGWDDAGSPAHSAPDWADRGPVDAGWDPRTARQDAGRDAAGGGAGWDAGWSGADPAGPGGRPPQAPGWDTGGWDTGGWDTGGWDAGGRHGQGDPDGATQATPLWGDDAAGQDDGWAVPTGRRARRRAEQQHEPVDAVPESSPSSGWGAQPAGAGEDAWGAEGDEPWAPRENVQTPRTGPFGLGLKVWGLIGAGVLVLAVLLVTAFAVPGWAVTTHLDQTALQNGVTKVLGEDYGLGVGAVQCPDDVVVSTGTEFRCQAVVDGEQVEVPGAVTSEEGDYQVDRV